MAALACPKCGAAIPAQETLPARCERCGAVLRCCRHCAFFDHRVLDCVHPDLIDAEHITDPDDVHPCRYFRFSPRSIAATQKTILSLSVSTWMSALALVVLGAVLYVGVTRSSTTAPMSALQLTIQAPGTIVREDPCEVAFTITNSSSETATNVSLTVPSSTLASLPFASVQPTPEGTRTLGKSMTLDFGDLPAGRQLSGSITFAPKDAGTFPIELRISAANIPKPESAETKIQITP